MSRADRDAGTIAPEKAILRYCTDCMYDLSAAGSGTLCPECGRGFDPDNPATFLKEPTPHWRRSPIIRWGGRTAIVLLILVAFMYTVLPRPVNLFDWRLWVWFGRPVGLMVHRFGDVEIVSRIWFGDESRREAREVSTGRGVWFVERQSEGVYRVKVFREGAHWRPIVEAFNAMKGKRFFAVYFSSWTHEDCPRAFEVSGDEAEVLGTLVRQYGFSLRPFRLTPSQEYVWDYDPDLERMVTIDLTPENIHEYQIRNERSDRMLMPRPARSP